MGKSYDKTHHSLGRCGYLAPIIEEHFGEDGPDKTVVTLPLTKKDNHHHSGKR